jgi:hypothetical protein
METIQKNPYLKNLKYLLKKFAAVCYCSSSTYACTQVPQLNLGNIVLQ